MTRKLISSGSPYEEKYAYSRAVVQGDWCFVAGSTGFDPATGTIPEDPADQARNTFRTIIKAMEEGGFSLADAVRVQITVTDADIMPQIGPVLQEYLGDIRPANTAVVADLVSPEMKVEIEVTAYRGK
ncbi:RidA family protein [Rhodobacteraceae bacterium NNCM2]|nr:RidA family protein [Coraliihabitans acroporae]